MPDHESAERETALSPREAAHLRNRDRKRSTRMVVDNAGVKRILLAQRARSEKKTTTPSDERPTGAPDGGGR
ncbi:MAG TPA: hypothetical protein VGQ42_05950 [Candidatus Dormibacteraeota bacterium]|nr:hypothetical protein [Candidatus Dormibacteraeota bacterium]